MRLSSRLTTSPACLVVGENDYSPMLERALRKGGADAPHTKRVMELNPKHPLIERMRSAAPSRRTIRCWTTPPKSCWGFRCWPKVPNFPTRSGSTKPPRRSRTGDLSEFGDRRVNRLNPRPQHLSGTPREYVLISRR